MTPNVTEYRSIKIFDKEQYASELLIIIGCHALQFLYSHFLQTSH